MKKPSLSVLLGVGPSHGDDGKDDGDGKDQKRECVQNMIQAVKDDDPEAFEECLSSFLDLHDAEEEDDDGHDDDAEEEGDDHESGSYGED